MQKKLIILQRKYCVKVLAVMSNGDRYYIYQDKRTYKRNCKKSRKHNIDELSTILFTNQDVKEMLECFIKSVNENEKNGNYIHVGSREGLNGHSYIKKENIIGYECVPYYKTIFIGFE